MAEKKKCGDCRWFQKTAQADVSKVRGFCHVNPPQRQVLPMQDPLGRTQIADHSGFPGVTDDTTACRFFEIPNWEPDL
jgi:hypothetical protein